MKIQTFAQLFMHLLQATYYAEQQITKALPKMIEAAESSELKQAFTKHLDETRAQVQRLDRVFQAMGEKPEAGSCKIIDAHIETCESLIRNSEMGPVRDAGLIMCGQGVEHYEITHYGTLASWAKSCGQPQAVALLQETLKEEKSTDTVLSQCAHGTVNESAAHYARKAA